MIFEPDDLMARLCAMVPPPWLHRIRFHGVLAPNATLRKQVVSCARLSSGAALLKPPEASVGVEQLSLFDHFGKADETGAPNGRPAVGLVVTLWFRRRCDGVSPMLRPHAMARSGYNTRRDCRQSGESRYRRACAAAKEKCAVAKGIRTPRAAHARVVDRNALLNTPPNSVVVRAWGHPQLASSCS